MNYELFKEMLDDERRVFQRQAERVEEDGQRINNHIQLLDGAGELCSKIDELTDEVERQQGLDTGNTSKMVRNWKSRGYVTQISDISFQKSTRR